MINVSNEFKRLLLGEDKRNYLEYVDITLTDGTELHLTNADFWQGGMEIEDAVSSDSSFDVGSAIINKCTLVIENLDDRFSEYEFTGARVVPYIGLELSDGTVEKISKGTFTVDEPKYNGSIITLECLDNMAKFDRPYSESDFLYPATLDQIVRDACSCCGVLLQTYDIPHGDFLVQQKPSEESTTFREVVAWAAQIAGCFARCDTLGRLELKWYDQGVLENPVIVDWSQENPENASDETAHWIHSNYSSPVTSLDDVVITGVRVVEKNDSEDSKEELVTYQTGKDGYVVSIEENELIKNGAGQTVAGWLGEQLIGVRFRKAQASHASNPLMEAGDIAVLTDRKGKNYNILVSYTKFSTGSAQSTESRAQEPARNSAARFSAQTKNYVEWRKAVQQEKTQRELAIQGLSERLENVSGVYTTVEQAEGGGSVFYLHNKPQLAESDMVWKMTAEAWGVSTDGMQTWNAGMTVDGDTIVRILDATGINADWINAGRIEVKDDHGDTLFLVDIDTGEITISADHVRIGGKNVTQALDDSLKEAKSYSDGKLADYANSVTQDFANVQKQLDGQIESYFENYEPTMKNKPASDWVNENDRLTHEGDIFYWEKEDGTSYAYRFMKDSGTGAWEWNLIQDTDITKAIADAAHAQDTADKKRRNFVIKPYPPYDIGDQWSDENGDILVCVTARDSGSVFASTDWQKLNKYTDDTVANQALDEARKSTNLTIILDNEYQGIPTDSTGNYSGTLNAQTLVQTYYGHQDVSSTCSYSFQKSEGVTYKWDDATRKCTITALTTDIGWVDITASYMSLFAVTKRFNVAKIKAGAKGADGKNGTNGVGVSGSTVTYQKSKDGVNPPSTWQETIPATSPGEYLWSKTVTNYTDGSSTTSYSVSKNGLTGTKGADGRGIKSTEITYQKSTSGTKAPTSTWGTDIPDVAAGEYLWTKVVYTYTDGTTDIAHSVSMMGQRGIQGLQGEKGEQGIPGKDGTTYYTWIKYADDASGNGISESPTNKKYIGIATNRTSPTESSTPGDYTWSLIKGSDGVPGSPGADGKTYYTWIKYAKDSKGTDISDDPTGRDYIGFAYNKESKTESNTPGDYIWSLIKGETGATGPAGANGKTSYFHIKYSSVSNPTTSTQMSETPAEYIGTYVDYAEADSNDPEDYTWSRFQGIQGAQGNQGIPGTNGTNGQTSYLHIKYSNDGGETFTIGSGEAVGDWIGQYVDFTKDDSTDPSKYTWSKIKGETGAAGRGISSTAITYAKGTNGTTAPESGWQNTIPSIGAGEYLWTKTVITYTDKQTSTLYSVGRSGVNGANGAAGANGRGIKTITNYYLATASGSNVTTGTQGWTPGIQTIDKSKKYLWNYEVIAYDDGSNTTTTPVIIGAYGDTGATGGTGAAGRGITEITEHYLASSAQTGVTVSTEGWSTTVQNTDTTKRYLWNYETISYTDGKPTNTTPKIIGTHGATGAQGAPGKDGTSTYTHIRYSKNADGSGFVETPTAETIYIGVYTGTSSSAPTTNTSYQWSKYKGDKGDTGAKGASGNGINTITYYYAANNSPTAPAATAVTGTSLNTVIASMSPTNKYLWQKEVIDFTDSAVDDKTTVTLLAVYGNTGAAGKDGENGKDGAPGANGTSVTITSTSIMYQEGTSGTTIPTSTWQTNVPDVALGHYLWTRTIVNYSDKTSTTSYSVAYKGTNGSNGKDGAPGKDGEPARDYFLEPSTLVVKRGADNEMSPNYVTFSAYYREGTTTARTAYAGRFKIEESLDGDKWTTVYTSASDETSITHSLYGALATSAGGAISTSSNKTLGIPRDVVDIRCTLYSAGGTTQMLDVQMVAVVIDVSALTHEEIFDLLTNDGKVKGIYQEGDQLYISFTYAKGGELTLGGYNNGNGRLSIRDASNNEVGYIDNNGVHFNQGEFSGEINAAEIYGSYIEGSYIDGAVITSSASVSTEYYDGDFEVRFEHGQLYINGATEAGMITADFGQYQGAPLPGTVAAYGLQGLAISGEDGGVFIYANNGCAIADFLAPTTTFYRDIWIENDLVVNGEKHRVCKTNDYSERLLSCYEMPSPMFGDIGEAFTDENGECYICLDDIFSETVSPEIEYQVFLQKEGAGDLWVDSKEPAFFIVKGTPNLKFAWEIKAKQKGYEYERMEIYEDKKGEVEINYEKQYIDEINAIIREQEEILYEKA